MDHANPPKGVFFSNTLEINSKGPQTYIITPPPKKNHAKGT